MINRRLVLAFMTLSLVVLAWWLVTRTGLISPFIVPPPEAVLKAARRLAGGYLGGSLATHFNASMSVVLTGYSAAVVVGVPLGIWMAWNPTIATAIDPLVSLLRPIPPPAWIPLAILWFGIGLGGKTFVVFVAVITPCIINAYVAIKEVPAPLIRAAQSLGASRGKLLLQVAIPSGLPTIMSGLRIALGTAWASIVAAELVVAKAGFGFIIMSGYRNFESSVMAVGIIAVALTGFLMNLAFTELEKWIVPWCAHE